MGIFVWRSLISFFFVLVIEVDPAIIFCIRLTRQLLFFGSEQWLRKSFCADKYFRGEQYILATKIFKLFQIKLAYR